MPRPLLPTYTDPENTRFHPVFKAAAKEALKMKGLEGHVELIGQYLTASGPADFVFQRRATGKIIFPVEIKRTKSSVRGQGRRQARDYWNNLGTDCETSFYCASNLELTEFFRNDPHRAKTSSQRIKLQSPIAGELGSSSADFYTNLINCIGELLDLALGNKPFEYATGLTEFQSHIGAKVGDIDGWHKLFLPVCYEYIRGAASRIPQLAQKTSTWKAADFYKGTPKRLIELGSVIDFEHIFKEPAPDKNNMVAFAHAILKEAHESGKQLGHGDDIAELVNELLAPEGPGIVETDAELAQLLAVIARDSLGRELSPDEEAFDPGAGSGRLLATLPLVAFPSLNPKQLRANEVDQRFAEPLSLRLGLTFAAVLKPDNAPTISISPIEKVGKPDLNRVRLVLMNPPYLSGVQAANIKDGFAARIKEVCGKSSALNKGQIALEALFLELVWHLVQPGTVIATVFPFQHLTRLSDEVAGLRRFLSNSFALTHIVLHPREGLFESVIKQTLLLVGKKGADGEQIKLIEVQKRVADVDFAELLQNLKMGETQPTHGVLVKLLDRAQLAEKSDEGWRGVLGAGARAQAFIAAHMAGFKLLEDLGGDVRRGTIGNAGNTSLTVFDKAAPRYLTVVKKIPSAWLRPVLNTTDEMPRILTSATAPEMSFLPPISAFTNNTADNKQLQEIVTTFLSIHQEKKGKQKKKIKDLPTILRNLKSDQKDFGKGWVLIQRASRKKGEISILEQNGILLSTNVPMVRFRKEKERRLFASWMLSVFGQIQLELHATPQEGLRKLEMGAIRKVQFPNFETIPDDIAKDLQALALTEPALEFSSIKPRQTDHLWAQILAPQNPDGCLNHAIALFQELVDERISFGAS